MSDTTSIENIRLVAAKLLLKGDLVDAQPYGSGHINETLMVTFHQAGAPMRYIFQRVNHLIFKNVPQLMENIYRVTQHGAARLAGEGDVSRRVLTVIPARDGKPYCQDAAGNFWRAYLFIEGARTYDIIENAEQAYEAARAFGAFQKLLVDLPGERLHETIPNFHHTRSRFDAMKKAVEEDVAKRAESVRDEIEFYFSREAMSDVLLDLQAKGKIPERVTHNDTKLNNVMLDNVSHEAVCVIDLDTVMPGLALYDFGDLVRTSTSPAAEDEIDLSKVAMQMPMFEALVRGYLAEAGDFLNEAEKAHLVLSGKLITFECGLRFLTDYLQGDVYFKTKRPNHNLDRCRTQMALVRSIEAQESAMEKLVRDLSPSPAL